MKLQILLILMFLKFNTNGQTPIICMGKECASPDCKNLKKSSFDSLLNITDFNIYNDAFMEKFDKDWAGGAFLLEYIDSNYTGELQLCHKNGKTMLITYINKGKFLSEIKVYRENGMLFFREEYTDGLLDGMRTSYYPNGQLKTQVNYRNEKKQGLCYWYFENGQLEMCLNFDNGKIQGDFISYHSNGIISRKVKYVDGLQHGVGQSFHVNGNISTYENFVNGKLQGCRMYYHSNSNNPVNKGFYVDDKLEGEYIIYYYESGKVGVKKNFVHGVEQGIRYEYYENGKIKREIEIIDGHCNGRYLEYFENGQLNISAFAITELIDNYYKQRWDGEYTVYDINGRKQYTHNYVNGEIIDSP